MILVTGASGRVGSAASRRLASEGIPFRVMVRHRARLGTLASFTDDIAVADFEDRTSLEAALSGISAALLVSPNDERQQLWEGNFIDVAAASGVRHVVKISSMEASSTAKGAIPRGHYAGEMRLLESGMRRTLLRPNFFSQNLLMFARGIAGHDAFNLPFGSARVAPIDTRDVGDIAAKVLSEDGHDNKSYTLTGSELVDFNHVAARLSAVLGREIRYIAETPADFKAFLGRVIASRWHVEAVCELFEQIAHGALEQLSGDAESLLGRPPRSLDAFINDHREVFKP